MAIRLLFAREKSHHNSVVALLGAIEREMLAGDCDVRLVPPGQIVAEYERVATGKDRCLVGFPLATPDVPRFARTAASIRPILRSGDLILAGGPHPTAADEATLALGADVVFRGEADLSFPLFIRALLTGTPWRDLPGLSFLDGSRVVRFPPPEPIAMDRVRSRFSPLRLLAPLELTRGCPCRCHFCQTPWLWGHRPRHRSPDNVLDELTHYRPSFFARFLSPNAFGYLAERPGQPNVPAIVALLEAARASHPMLRIIFGMFPGEVRPEYVRRDLVRAIRPLLANRYLAVGAQSGSDRVLAMTRRGHTAADVLHAAEIILGEGMKVLVDILFGLPGESPDDVRQTLCLMERIESWGGRFRAHIFTPLPGTPFAESAPAPPLDPETLAFLDDMARRGRLEGQWRR
jgi:B12-binding domain/radical SAM domain protein